MAHEKTCRISLDMVVEISKLFLGIVDGADSETLGQPGVCVAGLAGPFPPAGTPCLRY